eukprot:gene12612-6517_t
MKREREEETKVNNKKNKLNPRPKDRKKEIKYDIHDALKHLETFENDHKNWKFHKKHQIYILTNILNKKLIPKKYFKIALKYIINLEGNARMNLIELCENSMKLQRKKEEENLSDQENDEKKQQRINQELKDNRIYCRSEIILKVLNFEK